GGWRDTGVGQRRAHAALAGPPRLRLPRLRPRACYEPGVVSGVASAYELALPLRRLRRGMGFRRPLSRAGHPRGAPAQARPPRRLQRAALDGPLRRPLALPPRRLPTVGRRLPAD